MTLKITLIQSDLHWEDVTNNLVMFSNKIETIPEQTDVIVLPEMFNTGFSMFSEKLAETMSGKTVLWMKEQSQNSGAAVTGSLIIKEDNEYYNRLVWVQPDGVIYTYDKRHLFRMANEHKSFSAGKNRLIINYKGWRICPMICYDLRFPIWARNTTENKEPVYDCLIYMANWPAARKTHWIKLLDARAIENQCYVVGVNRVGNDGSGFSYSGNSIVVDSKGEPLSNIVENKNCTETVALSWDDLNNYRKSFPVSKDGDDYQLI